MHFGLSVLCLKAIYAAKLCYLWLFHSLLWKLCRLPTSCWDPRCFQISSVHVLLRVAICFFISWWNWICMLSHRVCLSLFNSPCLLSMRTLLAHSFTFSFSYNSWQSQFCSFSFGLSDFAGQFTDTGNIHEYIIILLWYKVFLTLNIFLFFT